MTGSADRAATIQDFLDRAGWGAAARRPVAGDASTRRYERLDRDGARAVLMDAPPAAESPACPPDADEAARRALGYNAVARLAGPDIARFAALSAHLRDLGLSAPGVLAADPGAGLMLLEDLGDDLYSRAVAAGADEDSLYGAAIRALAVLHAAPAPERAGDCPILSYDRMAALAETGLFLDWYAAGGGAATDEARAGWDAAWDAALDAARPRAPVLVLRDYHADNLIWLPDRDGAAQAGLLDFQDALSGHPAYDLVSLLEDARRDVAPRLAARMTDLYLELTGAPEDDFRRAMAVWAAQRNAKILGIFVRLVRRDGKARYLDYLPRVERLFANDLAHPALEGVRDWIGTHAPDVLKAAA